MCVCLLGLLLMHHTSNHDLYSPYSHTFLFKHLQVIWPHFTMSFHYTSHGWNCWLIWVPDNLRSQRTQAALYKTPWANSPHRCVHEFTISWANSFYCNITLSNIRGFFVFYSFIYCPSQLDINTVCWYFLTCFLKFCPQDGACSIEDVK